MMFKNVQEEEESGSDWDDLTPHNSPKYSQSTQLHEPSPQHSPSSAAHSPPSQPLLPIARSSHATDHSSSVHDPLPPTAANRDTLKSKSAKGVDFISLADQDTVIHPPPPSTPPITCPVYTVVTSHTPSTTPLSDQSPPVITFQGGISDPPLITPPAARPDDRGVVLQDNDAGHHHPHSGVFQFNVVAPTQQIYVEKEKSMQEIVMAGYANRSEKLFRRIFQEFFSALRLCTDIFIAFLLECAHCLVFHILRKLCCGLLFTFLSAMSGPGLTDCYNTIVWPLAVCCLHACQAGQMVVSPCVECLGWMAGRCVQIVSACRPVHFVSHKSSLDPRHIHHSHHHPTPPQQHV